MTPQTRLTRFTWTCWIAGTLLLSGCNGGASTTAISSGGGGGGNIPPVIPNPPAASLGDFRIRPVPSSNSSFNLDANGAGSLDIVLQSVSGFTAPITFPTSATVTDVNGVVLSSTADVSVTPASFTSLPAGDTPVTVRVRTASLPPLSSVAVSVRATGGGLIRYLRPPGAYATNTPSANDGARVTFYTNGLRVTGSDTNVFPNLAFASSLNASITASGLTGPVTITVEGLPAGITCVPGSLTLSGKFEDMGLPLPLTLNAPIPGTYPVRVRVSVGGTEAVTAPFNITVYPP